jgi:hypothetical protein
LPKLPRTIQVGIHTYTVNKTKHAARKVRDDERHGDCNSNDLAIRIDTHRPSSVVAETLLHETLHACWNQAGLNEQHDGDAEERAVVALAPLLLDVLQSNPTLIRYLTA